MMSPLNQTPKWMAALGLSLLTLQAAGAGFVEIAAELEMTGWAGSATNPPADAKPKIISLVCTVGPNAWRMENDFSETAEEKWLFDGTNVYNSVRITRPMSDEKQARLSNTSRLAVVPFDRAKSNLTIRIRPSPDGHPMADYSLNLPWLAFCSGAYLKRENRLVPLPVALLRHTRDRFGYTDRTTVFDDALGLPRRVDLFTSKARLEASHHDFDNEYFFGDRYAESRKKIVASLEEGLHIFHYEVITSTNFAGWNFPTHFEFHQMARSHEQNGDWTCRGTGRIKSIRPAAPPQGLFDPNWQQTVVDWRFVDSAARVSALTYVTTNSFVSPTHDPVLQEKWQERVARFGRPKPASK